MAADAAGRLAYLHETAELLWPAAAGRSRVVLPATRLPRVLVPRQPARAGAAALVRYTAQQGVRERVVGLAAAAAVSAGGGRLLPDAIPVAGTAADRREDGDARATESIDDLLERVLGESIVSTLPLTPGRANRKPVLQVFDRRGRTLAFAKVGVTELARELVDAEARSLQHLGEQGLRDSTVVDVARVLHHGSWRGTRVLITSALPLGRRLVAGSMLLQAGMRAVAGTGDPTAGTAYLAGLRARVAQLPDRDAVWSGLLDDLAASGPMDELPTGAWHGDWTAWNCSRHAGRVIVWDWERYAAAAPRGFDDLHFRLNDAVGKRRTGFAAAAPRLVAEAGSILAPWGASAARSRLVAGLYLFDVALRYVTDSTSSAAADAVERWAVPAIRDAARPERRGATSR